MALQEIFARVRAQLTELWERQDPKSRTRFLVIAAVCVLVLVVAVSLLAQTEWEILYEGISSRDAGEVMQQLQDMGERYRTPLPGIIEVPMGRAAGLRNRLAFEGGAVMAPDFGIYEMGRGFMATDQDRRQFAVWQQAENIRQDLLMSPFVLDARVTLVVDISGRPAAILSERIDPTANVMLSLRPGVALSGSEIRSIKNMVAASVARLTPNNVHVTDMFFAPLEGEDIEPTVMDFIREQHAIEQQLEDRWKNQIITMLLRPAGGMDKISASVNVEMNWNVETSESIIFSSPNDDGEGIAVAIDILTERASGVIPPGQPIGVDPNGGAPSMPHLDESQVMNYSRSHQRTNLEVNQILTWSEMQRGNVTKATAAVVIHGNRSDRSDEEIEYYTAIVARTIGLTDPEVIARSVTIAFLPFPELENQQMYWDMAQAERRREQTLNMIRALAPAVLIFIALLVVILQTFGLLRFKPDPVEVTDLLTAEQLELIGLATDGTPLPASFDDIDDMTLDEEALRAKNLREKLEEIINSNPAMAAELLRNWLSSDDHW
jgi:flagellar M-ring protein FliF